MVDVTRMSAVDPASPADHQRRQHDREDEFGAPAEERRRPSRTPHQIQDVAQIMGIPASELTPRVQEALSIIVGEFDRARAELDLERERVVHFQHLADKDPVVPALNRRAVLRDLGRLINRAEQTQTVSTVVLIAVAGLEQVRLAMGRPAADELLSRIVTALATGLRGSDVLGYLGGGDFGVILTLTEGDPAEAKAQDLVRRVESALGGSRGRVVWGVTSFDASDDAEAVMNAAEGDLLRRQFNPK